AEKELGAGSRYQQGDQRREQRECRVLRLVMSHLHGGAPKLPGRPGMRGEREPEERPAHDAELREGAEVDVVRHAVAAAVEEREPRVDVRLAHVLVEGVVEAREAGAMQWPGGAHGPAHAPG